MNNPNRPRYRARCVEAIPNVHNDKERLSVLFEITEGECKGQTRRGHLYLHTDKAVARTFDSLRHCGWRGDHLGDLSGVSDNEVEIECETRTDNQGRDWENVAFVNKLSRLNVQGALTGAALDAFAQKFRGAAIAHRQTYGGGAGPAVPPPLRSKPRPHEPDDHEPATDDGLPF